MAPRSESHPLLAWWESRGSPNKSIQNMVVIIVALVMYTLILNMMLHFGKQGRINPQMTTQDIHSSLDQIADEVNSMEEHIQFLRSGEPSLLRVEIGRGRVGKECRL